MNCIIALNYLQILYALNDKTKNTTSVYKHKSNSNIINIKTTKKHNAR